MPRYKANIGKNGIEYKPYKAKQQKDLISKDINTLKKEIISTAKTANSRLRRLRKQGLYNSMYIPDQIKIDLLKNGTANGFYSTQLKGKTKEQLIEMYLNINRFLSGNYTKQNIEVIRERHAKGLNISVEQMKNVERVIETLLSMGYTREQLDSDIQEQVAEYQSIGYDDDYIIKIVEGEIEREEERRQRTSKQWDKIPPLR